MARVDPLTTKSILWHAGSSAVSIAGIQLSRSINLSGATSASPPAPKVFATTRREDKRQFCITQLGCTGAVNTATHSENSSWAEELRALNGGEGFDVIFDFLGPPALEVNINLLATDGCIIQLGILQGPFIPANANLVGLILKRARLEGSQLRSRSVEYQIKLRELFELHVLPGLIDGTFDHIIDQVLSWKHVGEAHGLLETNMTKGKVVCVID